jgi:serine/threonine protein kinase/Tfp pilus assembly protein PilF
MKASDSLAPSVRSDGLAELVEEITQRLQRGDCVDWDRVFREHAEHADRLRELIPALGLLRRWEGASTSAPEETPVSQLAPIPSDLRVLGDFHLLREIGRGGMGVVHEAQQVSLNRRVALKVLPFAAIGQEKALQRFYNEVRAAAALDHPHIVSVYSVGEDRGVHFYAMQLVRGSSLAEVIERMRTASVANGPLSVAEVGRADIDHEPMTVDLPATGSGPRTTALAEADTEHAALSTLGDAGGTVFYRAAARLGEQAALALACAHDQGVLHRDVKPSNLLIDADGKLFVTDFGLARIQTDAGITLTGDLVGTLRYMAPEQLLAKRAVVDHRADVYSLGATLYELLALVPAFHEPDRSELLRQISLEEPRPLRKHDRRIPAELETIVGKSMAKVPEERYQTAHDLARDLRAFLDNRPIRATPPTLLGRAKKWARRNRPIVWASAAALLVSALAIAGSAGWMIRDRQTRQAEVEAKALIALEKAGAAYGRGDVASAEAAVDNAESLLAASEASLDIQARVRQWQSDVQMVRRLDAVRMEKDVSKRWNQKDSYANATRLYAQAFAEYGLELETLRSSAAVARIKRSPIRERIIAALDEWVAAEQGEINEALVALTRAVDDNLWRNRVRAAMAANDFDVLGSLAKEDSYLVQSPHMMVTVAAKLYDDGGDIELATDRLSRAQRIHPTDFFINFVLGSWLHQSAPGEAVGYLRIALSQQRDSFQTRINLGRALELAGKIAEAEVEYREAHRLLPDHTLPVLNLAALNWRRQEFDEAEAYARKWISLDPASANAYALLGSSLENQGQWRGAAESYLKSLRLRPDDWAMCGVLAMILFDHQQRDEAKAVLQELVANNPQNAECWHTAVGTLAEHREWAATESIGRKAVMRWPDDARFQQFVGWALRRQGKRDEAAIAFQEASRLDPDFGDHFIVGGFYASKGEFGYALEEFLTVVNEAPDNYAAFVKAGLLAAKLGDRPTYESMCQRMLDRFGQTTIEAEAARGTCMLIDCWPPLVVGGDGQNVVRLADLALAGHAYDKNSPSYLQSCRERSLAAYRTGDWTGALPWCEACRSAETCPPRYEAQCLVVEAMARWQLDNRDEAKTAYDQATKLIAEDIPGGSASPGQWWTDWLVYDVLRREAATMLETDGAARH